MRRPAAAAGLLLGVCCFCVALAALEARQSAAQEHGGDADAMQQSEQLRRLQEQTGGKVTDARVLVVPRFGCQLVDANETECMASLDAAQSNPCREKAMTGAALTSGMMGITACHTPLLRPPWQSDVFLRNRSASASESELMLMRVKAGLSPCLRHRCAALTKVHLTLDEMRQPLTASDDAGKASYKDTYLAPFARVVPFMAAAGVPNFEVAPAPGGWVRL